MMTLHIHPVEDTGKHLIDGSLCECEPKVVRKKDTWIIVHNSFDGREGVEMLKEICEIGDILITVDKSKGWEILNEDEYYANT